MFFLNSCVSLFTADALLPVTTVQLGELATFTCAWPKGELTSRALQWYKQSPGDILKLIARLQKYTKPVYGPAFSALRMEVKGNENISNLTILQTIQEDEGMYHCTLTESFESTWSGTYLTLKGNTLGSSNYTVVQTVSDPVRPGDSVTLQCSVLSDSQNKTCPGDLSVFWFRAGSQTSHPNIIYTDVDMSNKCEKRSKTQKRCVYSFSKNISSSDAGTYYCAVATCGEILFGNGAKLEADQTDNFAFIALMVAGIFLAISVMINIVLICYRTPRKVCGSYGGKFSLLNQVF
ncbi:uncharacterized protein LOC125007661 [Mugil cephalus]|uniref:uncharacterized protein LOC125007661 n=1 Tax=Mugil cephalus TaxID=48193 RepID=UPI001FB70056|nr:uncharacterized protein LOC125007661 [Mugil cephalus]